MASVAMCAFQHSTVAGGGRSLACSCTPLALSIVCSPAPLSSLRAVVSDESSNEDGGDWPGSEGWRGGCGEMSGGVEIAFYFHVVCASPPSLCAAWRRAITNKLIDAKTRGSWLVVYCPGLRMTNGNFGIGTINPTTKLHVEGDVKCNTITMTQSANIGVDLTVAGNCSAATYSGLPLAATDDYGVVLIGGSTSGLSVTSLGLYRNTKNRKQKPTGSRRTRKPIASKPALL